MVNKRLTPLDRFAEFTSRLHGDVEDHQLTLVALAKAEAKLAADPGKVGKLERQFKAAKTRIQNLRAELHTVWKVANNKGILAVSKADRRTVQKALHPDSEQGPARKKLLDKAAQIINPLFDALPTPGE